MMLPTFRFPAAAWAAFLFLLLIAGCGGKDDLNILLVTLDTTRADHLHCYGRNTIETPHLDALAREGILFENGIVPAPLTLPSHASMLTGLTPMAHGARLNASQRLGDGAVTLAELLKGQGYQTAAFIAAYVLRSTFGLAQGFDVYDEDLSGGKWESQFQFAERTADRVTDSALDWFGKRDRKKPFFMWVHYFDAHMNYDPPSPFAERYASDPYDGEIAFVDHQLGRVLEALRKDGAWKHTLVWVVGDHGESLGEHGEVTHSYTVYDATIHVPYIVSHPAGRTENPSPRWKPRHVEEQVETIDIYPTIAELVGAPIDHPIEGQSLLPLLDGGRWKEQPAYAESMVPLIMHEWAPPRAVRTRHWEYIRAPRPELYDLTTDPKELHNVADQHPEELAQMRKDMERLVARAERARIESDTAQLDETERAMLVSLGYLQTDGQVQEVKELDPKELELPDPKDYVWAASQYLMGGIQQLTHSDPAAAEKLFRGFLDVDPESGEGRFYLGLALRDQGKYDEALRLFREADERNPGSYKTILHLGITLQLMGRYQESRPWFVKAGEINPYSGEPLFLLGNVEEERGDKEKALEYYDRALALDDGNSTFHLRRGLLLDEMGRKEEGEQALQRAVQEVARSPQSLFGLATSLSEAKRVDLAQPLFEELVSLEPENAVYLMNLGNCLLVSGEYQKAAETFRKAVSLDPEKAQYHYLLGCAYSRVPDYALARSCFERALELDPSLQEARHNLKLIEGRVPPG